MDARADAPANAVPEVVSFAGILRIGVDRRGLGLVGEASRVECRGVWVRLLVVVDAPDVNDERSGFGEFGPGNFGFCAESTFGG
jgi:hypothetical protein